jgi:transposase
MLADDVDFVVGVDTHKECHTAAVVNPTGGHLATTEQRSELLGHRILLRWAKKEAPGRRVWAIEGTGSFGAGLCAYLSSHGERVVEIDRPARPARRNGAKTDELDAVRAAREALSRRWLAEPRARGEREAIRTLLVTRNTAVESRTRALLHLHALVINAPEGIRGQLRHLSTKDLVACCARLRTRRQVQIEHRATIAALRATARRVIFCEAEANDLETQLEDVVRSVAPMLLEETGVGIICAAQILNAWSHPGRVRTEAAFAALAGVAPIPASSGKTVRHRLNRGGDRQLNRALHTIVLTRLRVDPETRAYAARREEEGKNPREIKRCLKRYVARRIYRVLEAPLAAPPQPPIALDGT